MHHISSSSICPYSNSNSFYFPDSFPEIENVLEIIKKTYSSTSSTVDFFRDLHQHLLQLILQAPERTFLFKAVLDFFERVSQIEGIKEPLTFATFEIWLNHFSDLSLEIQHLVRAKIAGKYIPRHDYQAYFPIGMGRIHEGSHFVAAHLSPDVDTMIASFWGWLDAFAARVSTGVHYWCLPGGPPDSPVVKIFEKLCGPSLFPATARPFKNLFLTAIDLLTSQKLTKECIKKSIDQIVFPADQETLILVDDKGHYLGDWQRADLEAVRPVIGLFKTCLYWFETHFQSQFIALFTNENLSIDEFQLFVNSIFELTLDQVEPVKDFNAKQLRQLELFLTDILKIKTGLETSFKQLNEKFNQLGVPELFQFQQTIHSFNFTLLFDQDKELTADHAFVFTTIQSIIHQLNQSIHFARDYVERLEIALNIKKNILNIPCDYIFPSTTLEEIQEKIQGNHSLTVVLPDASGDLFPIGIVKAQRLLSPILGTASFRDFCNFEEVKMAPYLEVISVIDHHKNLLQTKGIPTIIVGDVQSCNILLAEQAFLINDRYSTAGMSAQQIDEQIQQKLSQSLSKKDRRLLQRLLQKKTVLEDQSLFYVHPAREFNEYFSFLQAILDDTDLLTKVSERDLFCIAHLLNRLKTICVGYETEVIDFDDIPKDQSFIALASRKILQQEDMYAIYKQVYNAREGEVDVHLNFCINEQPSNLFLDSKEQNGCARIGQTKIFASNFPYYLSHANQIRQVWLKQSQAIYKNSPEIDLYIHMFSTIASADEVYHNRIGPYSHLDELWIWVPNAQGLKHLNHFLVGFYSKIKELKSNFTLEFIGERHEEFERICLTYFAEHETIYTTTSFPSTLLIIRFKAGILNSRKAMVSPFLPRLKA